MKCAREQLRRNSNFSGVVGVTACRKYYLHVVTTCTVILQTHKEDEDWRLCSFWGEKSQRTICGIAKNNFWRSLQNHALQDTQFVNLQKHQWCYYSWHQGQLFVSSNQFPYNQSWTAGCYQASKLWVFSHSVDLYLETNQQGNDSYNFCRAILCTCTFKKF